MPRYPRVEDDDYDWTPYVTVGERRRKAERQAAKIKDASPVHIEGSRIAKTFWGQAWCRNLERYSDYSNRLPRGRTYVRSGCVVDLKIEPCAVIAVVSGSKLYRVRINVVTMPAKQWEAICKDSAGAIDSLVELLEGRFSRATMERFCQPGTGMFPQPREINFHCSCPDSARMCKHVAAVLYAVGARLDEKPELLFTLRNVNQQDLISGARLQVNARGTSRRLEKTNLSELFGIDIVESKRKPRKSP